MGGFVTCSPVGNRRAEKGQCLLRFEDLVEHIEGQLLIVFGDVEPFSADEFVARRLWSLAPGDLTGDMRVLTIAVALAYEFLCERQVGQRATRPPAIASYREAVRQFEAGRLSAGLEYAAYLLKAVLDRTTLAPPVDSAADLFAGTSARIETLFPATWSPN